MRPRNGIIAALLMAVLLVLLPPAARAAELRLVPATVSATIGDVVPLAIQVDTIANLAGFQFDFSFVPAALEVKKITIAPAFEHLVRGSYDNAAGSGLVAAYGVSAVPVSGTNITLATLEFTVKASGAATVNFANQLLGAYGGDEIPSTKGTVAGTLITGKLLATVTLAGLTQPYDGTPKSVTATTEPPDLPVGITYDGSAAAPVNIGSYAVVAIVNHADYGGSASGTLVISASYPFRIAGNPPHYYPTLAEAYRNAMDTDVIEIRAGTVVEDLIADKNVGVTLKGGFDDLFSPNRSGSTTIQGTIALRAGKVVMNGIRVKGASAGPDIIAPVVALAAVPPLTALTVQVVFSASDAVGVTGYLLSESPLPPSANDLGWLASAPASYTFGTFGDKTLYGYARDAAGNVGSAVASFGVYAVPSPYVRIGLASYATLQDAYDKANSGDEIMLMGGTLASQISALTANRTISIVISGGYDAGFGAVNSETVLQGQMLLKAGTVKVKNVKLRQ